jgi:hypothetical protein
MHTFPYIVCVTYFDSRTQEFSVEKESAADACSTIKRQVRESGHGHAMQKVDVFRAIANGERVHVLSSLGNFEGRNSRDPAGAATR